MTSQLLPPLILPSSGNGNPVPSGPPGPPGADGAPGAPGPQGPQGPAGGSGSNIFVYRDSEPSPSGNVYATFAGAYAAALATGIPATIVIDDSLHATSIPTAGDYDLHQITLMGSTGLPYDILLSVGANVTFNEGIYRITGGIVFQNSTSELPSIVPSTQQVFTMIVDNYSVLLNDLGKPMFDLALMNNGNGAAIIIADNGGAIISGGSSGTEVIDLGTTSNNSVSVYVGKQESQVDQFLFVNGNNSSISMFIDAGAYTGSAFAFPNYTGTSFGKTFTTNSQYLNPFVSTEPLPTTSSPANGNIVRGQMIWDQTANKPYWFSNEPVWITYPDPYEPEFINATLTAPQSVNTGDLIIWNNFPATVTNLYVGEGSPGQFFLNFLSGSGGKNVSFKLTGNVNAAYSGNFNFQWWDITNNIGLGNISSNVGNAIPDDVVAMIPYNYSSVGIDVGLKIIFESGSTTLGGTINGSLVVPWAVVETIGAPR